MGNLFNTRSLVTIRPYSKMANANHNLPTLYGVFHSMLIGDIASCE